MDTLFMMETQKKDMPLDTVIAVARLWLAAGENNQLELAALEPTLWHDKHADIADLVMTLKQLCVKDRIPIVSITSNGINLKQFIPRLKNASVDKIRISWHTCNADIFAAISGQNKYSVFKESIDIAVKHKMNVSFNRLLLKNYISDLPQQLEYIEKHQLSLKLYDLFWTHKIRNIYNSYYISVNEVIQQYVEPVTTRIDTTKNLGGRTRTLYYLTGGGTVQTKDIDKTEKPSVCHTCLYQNACLEGYGDYLRVDTNLFAFPCYLRRDLGFSLQPYLQGSVFDIQNFKKKLDELFSDLDIQKRTQVRLRYILTPCCNCNCCFPGTDIQWCLKSDGGYRFAKRTNR